MDGGAWWAAVHGVAKSQSRLSNFTFTFYFHALEKEMAPHSSVLAWRIPGTGKPGGLLSVGSHRVGHDWSDLAAASLQYHGSHCPSSIIVIGQESYCFSCNLLPCFRMHPLYPKDFSVPETSCGTNMSLSMLVQGHLSLFLLIGITLLLCAYHVLIMFSLIPCILSLL